MPGKIGGDPHDAPMRNVDHIQVARRVKTRPLEKTVNGMTGPIRLCPFRRLGSAQSLWQAGQLAGDNSHHRASGQIHHGVFTSIDGCATDMISDMTVVCGV
jgi:hypothetical protein